jgi:hypothetical protein
VIVQFAEQVGMQTACFFFLLLDYWSAEYWL